MDATFMTFKRELNEIEEKVKDSYLHVKLCVKDQLLSTNREHEAAYVEAQVERFKEDCKRLIATMEQIKIWRYVLETLHKNDEYKKILKEAEESEGDDVPDIKQLLKRKYDEAEKTRKAPTYDKHPFWQELMKIINPEQDDELQIVQTQDDALAFRCPLTTGLLEDPWRNKGCHHTFSRTAIFQMLHNKHEIRCPQPGCTSTIRQGTLERDKEKVLALRRYVRMTQAASLAQDDDDDGAEEIAD